MFIGLVYTYNNYSKNKNNRTEYQLFAEYFLFMFTNPHCALTSWVLFIRILQMRTRRCYDDLPRPQDKSFGMWSVCFESPLLS